MADEEKEGSEDKAAEEVKDAAQKQKKKQMILYSVIGAVVLITVLVLLYFIFGGDKVLGSDAASSSSDFKTVVEAGAEEEIEYGEDEEALGAMFPLETFVVNLSGGGFVKAQVQLEFSSRTISKRFLTKLIPIRDAMISLMSSKKRSDLLNREGKEDLKAEIIGVINESLGKPEIKNVYFTNFVVQ